MCECYQIGGPWIDVDPDCPIHNSSHRDYVDHDEMDQIKNENEFLKEDLSDAISKIKDLQEELSKQEDIVRRYNWLRDKVSKQELTVAKASTWELEGWSFGEDLNKFKPLRTLFQSGDDLDGSIEKAMHQERLEMMKGWEPEFSKWRHGGWYVDNIRYPSGACGCVSNNYVDKKWRIACDDRRVNLDEPGDFTFKSRKEAALAEYELVLKLGQKY